MMGKSGSHSKEKTGMTFKILTIMKKLLILGVVLMANVFIGLNIWERLHYIIV